MTQDIDGVEYEASIRAALSTSWLGRPLHYHAAVTSTNDVLAELAQNGAPAGTLLVTDFQSLGKGRRGRRWSAPAGTSLLFSLLLRPSWPPESAAWLTMLAGLAAIEAIEAHTELRPMLKWPNDLMLLSDGRWFKVGGMLLEGQLADGRWNTSILGIGINVNIGSQQLPDARLPATSLLLASGQNVDRASLLNKLLLNVEKGYAAADAGHSPREAWEARLMTLGQRVAVALPGSDQPLQGFAERTDEWGRLIVRDDKGHEHALSAADVTLQVDNSGD